MVHVALCDRDDGVLDDSERAVLVGFARAFGVDPGFIDRAVEERFPRSFGHRVARALDRLRRRPRSSSSSSMSSSFASSLAHATREAP